MKKSPIITISPIFFTFNAGRQANAVAQRNILEIKNPVHGGSYLDLELFIFVENLILSRDLVPRGG
jgi:hypothetical protein